MNSRIQNKKKQVNGILVTVIANPSVVKEFKKKKKH